LFPLQSLPGNWSSSQMPSLLQSPVLQGGRVSAAICSLTIATPLSNGDSVSLRKPLTMTLPLRALITLDWPPRISAVPPPIVPVFQMTQPMLTVFTGAEVATVLPGWKLNAPKTFQGWLCVKPSAGK